MYHVRRVNIVTWNFRFIRMCVYGTRSRCHIVTVSLQKNLVIASLMASCLMFSLWHFVTPLHKREDPRLNALSSCYKAVIIKRNRHVITLWLSICVLFILVVTPADISVMDQFLLAIQYLNCSQITPSSSQLCT